ncbi:hypothetical protein EDB19DRAFT_1898779 [Suillus lakei]|nr:hypothetical protein EDB19DRAFT_1898779 [Suillus lakei]
MSTVVDSAHEAYFEDDSEPTKKRNRNVGENPLAAWLHERDVFILEILACGCYGCPFPAEFHCEDCLGTELYCQSCTVQRHYENPLHMIKHWKDAYFHDVTLKSLGLRIQLGHPTRERCYNPTPCQDFVVLHMNGVHEVSLDFCGCETAQSLTTQLLRIRWFPATYWQTLTRLTHNRGVVAVKGRYDTLLRMTREWRHSTMLKCFGRGHDPAGTGATEQGSCAVLCPACPHPGKNLLEDWESAPPETRWLYALFLAIDANFHQMDPGLNDGWAYFVEEQQYKMFLADKSTCASHDAVNLAETKNSRGLAATGAGTVDCSRHNFKRPCGVGDLQKGEKYVNMDYIFFSTMRHAGDVAVLNVSYDIACQWSKHLWQRMGQYPSTIHLRHHNNKTVTFLVPKFHLPAHIELCQITYSHNLLKGMGRTDGEAPERGWANINPVATSTREMGPGSRRDTLDDHFGDFNWKKITNMGVSLSRKLKAAYPERDQHMRDFEDFNNALQHERPEQVAEWTLAVERWESDSSQENPFASTGKPPTQAAVRLNLSQQEAENLKRGMDDSLHEEVSRSVLISSGMEIEDQQCRLARDLELLGAHPTDLQRTKLQERGNILRRKIEQWCNVQLLYMPIVARLRASDISTSRTHSTEEKAHEIELQLPSKICGQSTDTLHQCDATLYQYEWELRRAQAYDALDELRRHLRLRTHLYKFKDAYIRGQRANTRASAIIDKVESNISIAAARYRRAWTALENLSPALSHTTWKVEFPKLENVDIRGMSQGKPGQSSGNRTLSWIWKVRGIAGDASEGETVLNESLRIEWCKSRARAKRWVEEVQLLREEMRRVAAYLSWHAAWWDRKQTVAQGSSLQRLKA